MVGNQLYLKWDHRYFKARGASHTVHSTNTNYYLSLVPQYLDHTQITPRRLCVKWRKLESHGQISYEVTATGPRHTAITCFAKNDQAEHDSASCEGLARHTTSPSVNVARKVDAAKRRSRAFQRYPIAVLRSLKCLVGVIFKRTLIMLVFLSLIQHQKLNHRRDPKTKRKTLVKSVD